MREKKRGTNERIKKEERGEAEDMGEEGEDKKRM